MQNNKLRHNKLAILGTAISLISINQIECAQATEAAEAAKTYANKKTNNKTLTEVINSITADAIAAYKADDEVTLAIESPTYSDINDFLTKVTEYLSEKNKESQKALIKPMVKAYKSIKIDKSEKDGDVYTNLVKLLGIPNIDALTGLLQDDVNMKKFAYDTVTLPAPQITANEKTEDPDIINYKTMLYTVDIDPDTKEQHDAIKLAHKMDSDEGKAYLLENIHIASDALIPAAGIKYIQSAINNKELRNTTINNIKSALSTLALKDIPEIVEEMIKHCQITDKKRAKQIIASKNTTLNTAKSCKDQLKTAIGDQWESIAGCKRSPELQAEIQGIYDSLYNNEALENKINLDNTVFPDEETSKKPVELSLADVKRMNETLAKTKTRLNELADTNAANDTKIKAYEKEILQSKNAINEKDSTIISLKKQIQEQKAELDKIQSVYNKKGPQILKNYGFDKSKAKMTLPVLLNGLVNVKMTQIPKVNGNTLDRMEAYKVLENYLQGGTSKPIIGEHDITKDSKYIQIKKERDELQTKYNLLFESTKDNQNLIQKIEDLEQEKKELNAKIELLDTGGAQKELEKIQKAIDEAIKANDKDGKILKILKPIQKQIAAIYAPGSEGHK